MKPFPLIVVFAVVMGGPASMTAYAGGLDQFIDLDEGCAPDGLTGRIAAYFDHDGFWRAQLASIGRAMKFNENWIAEAELEVTDFPEIGSVEAANDAALTQGQRESFQRITQGTTKLMLRANIKKQENLLRCKEVAERQLRKGG
ncbi:MAG: hypothetical protein V3R66_06980 [Rhodospirillales bacterium]